jgi:hypothetical protein
VSVLSFPRIYFKGYMEWDPCTFNNNDWAAFTTYDPVNAALNWGYLAQFNITRENFKTTFRPWAITLQPDNNSGDPDPGTPRVPCEWNMFGSHGVSFVQYNNYVSQVTGGDFGDGTPVAGDPIIGGQVTISGDRGNGPARLVDTNPASPWSSQIYWGELAIGSGNASFSGPREVRMHSRWLNPNRMYTAGDALLAPASGIGVTFQTAIPNHKVNWPAAPGTSPLITKLQEEAAKPGALGIMIRFVGYVNAYFSNGVFNSTPQQPLNYNDLAGDLNAAWQTWYESGGKDTSNFFSNPCYSHIVGVVGVWKEGELASVPGGRCLNSNTAVTPLQAIIGTNRPAIVGHQVLTASSAPASVLLGPVAAEIDYKAKRISLDLSATMPELGVTANFADNLTKADFGPLLFGAIDANGKFEHVATIDYAQYARVPYETSAGIIDIPFPGEHTGEILKSGTLAINVIQNPAPQTALLEEQLTAETDARGIYLDEGEATSFEITVCQDGQPAAGVNIAVARYSGFSKATMQGSGLPIIATGEPQQVNFTNTTLVKITVPNPNTPPPTSVQAEIGIVTTGANGKATVGISAQSPSFPVLGFYPYRGSLPADLVANSFNFIDNAYYTTVRVLPFDGHVPQAFVDLWNKSENRDAAWHFIYHEILYLYDMLFNVMLEFVNLGSLESVEGHLNGIWALIAKDLTFESTMAMPITRDMSAGKRLTLQLWIYLVSNKYNVPGFNVGSIPAGWSPGK